MKKYAYLSMPCDKEEVRKLNAQGFKVLDEKFKPADETPPAKPKAAPKKRAVKK